MAEVGRLEVVLGLRNELTKGAREAEQSLQGLSSAAQTAASAITAIGAGATFQRLVSEIGEATEAYNRLQAAQLGASTVARRMGEDLQAMHRVLQEVTADGLLPMADAATALKNLMAAGFGLEEARNLLTAFKDAAAFGRQSALSFGEAVRSASEGIKNGNSILVDNAGITKNLSVILQEAGFSAQDLSRATSDASVRQALYNGILKEAALFQGDAARLADELAGAQSRQAAEAEKLQAAVGEALAPAIKVLTERSTEWLRALRVWAEINPETVRSLAAFAVGVTGAATAVAGATAAVGALGLALSTLGGPLTAAVAALGVLGGALVTQRVNAAAAAEEERRQAEEVSRLFSKYQELTRVLETAKQDSDEYRQAQADLYNTQQDIAEILPEAVTKWDTHKRAIEVNWEMVQKLTQAQKDLKQATEEAAQSALSQAVAQYGEIAKQASELQSVMRVLESGNQWQVLEQLWKVDPRSAKAMQDFMNAPGLSAQERQALIDSAVDDAKKKIRAQLDTAESTLRRLGGIINRESSVYGGPGGNVGWAAEYVPLPSPPKNPDDDDDEDSGGGGGPPKMSAGLRNALEDLQDLQALPRTPENLQALLDRILGILTEFDGELVHFTDQKRGLERLATQLRDWQIPQAQFDRQLKQLLHQAELENWEQEAPEKLKAGLEALQQEWAGWLNRPENLDLAQALEQRIAGANDALDRYLQDLQRREAEAQAEWFRGTLEAVQRNRERQMADLAEQAAGLEAQIVSAEQEIQRLRAEGADTTAAEERLRSLREQLAGLFRPVLEAERGVLELILQNETLTAEQRWQVEQRLNQVKEELRQSDLQSHRLAEEAKTAATQREAQARAEAERRSAQAVQSVRQALRLAQQEDLDTLRQQQSDEEARQQRRIDRLRRELQALEQRNREEERTLRLEELRQALARAEESGPLEQFIAATGEVIWRNPEAERLRREIEEEERRQAYEEEREDIQRRIEAAERRLQVLREEHQRAYQERQEGWQALLALDDEELAQLVSQTETHLGEDGWYGTLSHWLSEAVDTAQSKVSSIVSELNRVVAEAQAAQRALDSLSGGGGGAPAVPAPSPESDQAQVIRGPGGIALTPFAHGGIATVPTPALLAERGVPEYVIPADYLSDLAGRLARLLPSSVPSAGWGGIPPNVSVQVSVTGVSGDPHAIGDIVGQRVREEVQRLFDPTTIRREASLARRL